jgi:hypothetical protein
MVNKVKTDMMSCGFDKWSIGIDELGNVLISGTYHPLFVDISLHDASAEELTKIGKMFLKHAKK